MTSMTKLANPRFMEKCPNGCPMSWESSGIELPEGQLLRCLGCQQLVSQCSEDHYWKSMEEFNDPRGTLPDARSVARGFRRHGKFLAQLSRLRAKTPGQIKLLDVGCSSGAFLHSAVKLGYLAEGVEPAERAAATAQASGLKVFRGLLHEAKYPDASFDAVTLLEVIEHLQNPLALLQEIQRILKPGGILLVGTGNAASWSAKAFGAQWDYFKIRQHGGHVSFFNPDSLKKLGAQAGFTQALLTTRSVRFSDRTTSQEPAYSLLKIAAELLNPVARWLDVGEDMAMYFRRTT